MSECEEYQKLISRLLDEDLDAEEKTVLAAHLKTCPECAALYVAFRSVSECVSDDIDQLPEGLHEDIMAGIRRETIKEKNRRPFRAIAACFAVILICTAAVLPRLFADSKSKKASPQMSLMTIEAPSAADDADAASNETSEESAAAGAANGTANAQDGSAASDKASSYFTDNSGSGEGDYRKASFPKIIMLPDEEHIRQFESLLDGSPAELPDSYDAEFLVCYKINDNDKYVSVFICTDRAFFAVIGRTSLIEFEADASAVLAILNF